MKRIFSGPMLSAMRIGANCHSIRSRSILAQKTSPVPGKNGEELLLKEHGSCGRIHDKIPCPVCGRLHESRGRPRWECAVAPGTADDSGKPARERPGRV